MMPMWNGWLLGTVSALALLLLLIAGVVVVARLAMQHGWLGPPRQGDDDAPLAILKRRYARGEIDRDEFERMKRELL